VSLLPTRVLTFVCLLAAAGLAYLWFDKNGQPRNTQWLAPAPIKSTVVATKIPERAVSGNDVAELASALERPIFTPDRKPPSVAPILAVVPPPPPDPMASVTVVGLITGSSGGAMVRSDGKVRFISLNQRFGEWTLSSIEERNASFARAGETRVIKLAYAPLGITNRAAVAATASAAPAQVAANSPAPMPEFARRQAEEAADRKRYLDEINNRLNQKKP
jgi:hypothetical protein